MDIKDIKLSRNQLRELIKDNTMEAAEVREYLGISKQRLSNMNHSKLVPLKKGIYLKQDVEEIKKDLPALREKYYKR